MDTIFSISDHPKFPDIKRKVELLPLTIDYRFKIANWPFQIIHTDQEGNELLEVPRANGLICVTNGRVVNPATGVRIPLAETTSGNERPLPPPVVPEVDPENPEAVETPEEPEVKTEQEAPVLGIPEFDFLRGMLMMPNVDPLVLGLQRVLVTDSRGNFDNYGVLMDL